MSVKIAIFEDGKDEYADINEECFEKLHDFFIFKTNFMMNTMKRFSEELIIHIIQLKTRTQVNIPLLFSDLKPVGLLHHVGNFYSIVYLVDKLSPGIELSFNRNRENFLTENGVKEFMLQTEKEFFICNRDTVSEVCPSRLNSKFLHKFLCYLAFSVEFAGLAYIGGTVDAPKWMAVEMAATICRHHTRLASAGGWKELRTICENFQRNPESLKGVMCLVIEVDSDEVKVD